MIVYSVYHNRTLLVQCSDIHLANEFFNRYVALIKTVGMNPAGVTMQSETIWTVSSKLDIDDCMDFIKGITKDRPICYYGDRVVEHIDPR